MRRIAAHKDAAWDIACLMGLALAYRLGFMLAMPRVLDTADAVHYLEAAQRLAQGELWNCDPKIPILYPALGALFSFAVPDFERACTLVSLLASVLAVVPLYALARTLHGRVTARLAGATLAIWPWMADYGCRVGNEALGLLCWLWAVCYFARAFEKGGWRMGLAALPFFALHLTRAEGLALWCAAPFAAAILKNRELYQASGRRERDGTVPDFSKNVDEASCRVKGEAGSLFYVTRLAPFFAVSLALLAANTLFVRALSGTATANYRIHLIIEEFDWLRFGNTALKSLFDVYPVMLGPVLLLFLGTGFFWPRNPDDAPPRNLRLECYLLFFAAVQTTASWFVLSPAPRYLMAPLAVLAIWAVAGMTHVARHCGGSSLRHAPVAALAISMFINAAVTVGSEHLGRRPREPREYKLAGQWMREHLEPGVVFTRKPQLAYYAGMPSTGPVPEDSLEAALDRARNAGARYVAIDERYGIPGMLSLLEPDTAPASLRLLHLFDAYPQSRVAIYELADSPR